MSCLRNNSKIKCLFAFSNSCCSKSPSVIDLRFCQSCQRTKTGVWKGLKKGWVCCIWETSFQRLSTRDAHQHLFIFLPDTLCTPCQTTDRDGLGSLSKEKQETPADTWVTRDSAVIPYNAVARKNRLFGFAYLLRVQRPHNVHVHVLLSLLKKKQTRDLQFLHGKFSVGMPW